MIYFAGGKQSSKQRLDNFTSSSASSNSSLSSVSSGGPRCYLPPRPKVGEIEKTSSAAATAAATKEEGAASAAAAARLAEAGALLAASWASSWDRDLLWSALSSSGQPQRRLVQSRRRFGSGETITAASLEFMKTSATIEDFRNNLQVEQQQEQQAFREGSRRRQQASVEWPLPDHQQQW